MPTEVRCEPAAGPGDRLAVIPQYLLPHHFLSRIVYRATRWRTPWWKNALIQWFVRRYRVPMAEAAEPDPRAYACFNDFFTRALEPGARPLPDDPAALASPVDGTLSALGPITDGRLIQAKGRDFSLLELIGGDETDAAPFRGGSFATIYLSPRDYHRIHMPVAGRLQRSVYVPGRLFTVAPHAVRAVPRLFARNERLVALFDTDSGPLAVILVGALFVACIETVWEGVVTPPHRQRIRPRNFDGGLTLARGDELGRFNMGSTVILLFGPDAVDWRADLAAGDAVRMGQALGDLIPRRD